MRRMSRDVGTLTKLTNGVWYCKKPGMAERTTENLLQLCRKNPLLDGLHQGVRGPLVGAHCLQHLLRYPDELLASWQCPEVGVEGHLVDLGEEGAHWSSEPLVTAGWTIKSCDEMP